jgi:hypothetical protein
MLFSVNFVVLGEVEGVWRCLANRTTGSPGKEGGEVADVQLVKGSIRLAQFLNDTFKCYSQGKLTITRARPLKIGCCVCPSAPGKVDTAELVDGSGN